MLRTFAVATVGLMVLVILAYVVLTILSQLQAATNLLVLEPGLLGLLTAELAVYEVSRRRRV